MDRFIVISGCSGAGKSTLLAELARRGYATVEEPGRRIVREEMASQGNALPWVNMEAFARRAIAMTVADHAAAAGNAGWTFFDRSLVDAASALCNLRADMDLKEMGNIVRYRPTVFMTEPWPELFSSDGERRHDMTDARAEYHRLLRDYAILGYHAVPIPKLDVAERADFVLATLGAAA